jgi:hypothetical protein
MRTVDALLGGTGYGDLSGEDTLARRSFVAGGS